MNQPRDVYPEPHGLSRACRELAAGNAVVVPNPAPLSYGIVATTAPAVNRLKRRPSGQNVAVSMHDRTQWHQVKPGIDLPPAALDAVGFLLERRLSVLVPVRSTMSLPRWVAPAVRDGYLAVFDGSWAPTARLWQQFPRLYGSSANPTGRPPATSAAQAAAAFGDACAVVDADGLDGPPGSRWASTMVRIDPTGLLELHRSGAQDTTSGLPSNEYCDDLADAVGLTRGTRP